MNRKPNLSADPAELRRRAEASLRDQRKGQRSKAGDPPRKGSGSRSEADTVRMLHELEVHQIELEMQNAELQKARDEMEVVLERYTDLYDFAPVGYFSIEVEGLILEVNLTGAVLLGVERSRLIRLRLERFVAPESRTIFKTFLEEVFAGSKDQGCEALLLKEGGGTFWASFRATAAIALEGTRQWCRVAVSDISARKRAEEVLRQNEAMFSALIAQAPIGVYVVDDRMCMQQVNPIALSIFRKVQPLIGRDFSEIIQVIWPRQVADQVVERFRLTLKTGEPYQSSNFAERRRDIGVQEIYEWQIQRVTLPAGAYAVVCFFSNITERKRAEETQRRVAVLDASNRKLELEIIRRQAVEEALRKSEQHEIRSSAQARHLSHQILHAQEKERKRISRELHDEIAQTLVGINVHLAALTREATDNPRDLPRQIARTQRLVEKSVDVVHLFARELRPPALDDLGLVPALHAFMKEFTKRTGIHIHFTTFTSHRIKQLNNATRTMFYRVAQEALTNVARHAQASVVEVNFEKLPNALCLKIKDNGKSFQAQRVLHSKRNTRLGLIGMRERLEMVDGTFVIESSPGKGTTIIAQIPIHKAARGGGADGGH